METDAKIFVAGHQGLVGSAIVRRLEAGGHQNVIVRTRSELALLDDTAVATFFAVEKPTYVFLAAAKVGGIMANKEHPAEFIYQNLQIQNNVIHHAYMNGVKKLLFLGSSCIYPKLAPQPITEASLLSGPLEETNKAYSVAKIAGIVMCQAYNRQYGTNFISVMPTNLYGPNDNFNTETSHVLPALIRKFHDAKQDKRTSVTLWGTGAPRREFLHVDDLADAVLFLMDHYDGDDIVNVGTGKDISIKELAELISAVVDYTEDIVWDDSKPDGTPQKLLSVEVLHHLGWRHRIGLRDGIKQTYGWYASRRSNDTA